MTEESVTASDFDINEAAANAKKLALSTNSGMPWGNPYSFDFYSQIPPPNFYQSTQVGSGVLNFMTGSSTSFAPPPIPQLSSQPPRPIPVARHPVSARHPHPYHPSQPFYNNFPRQPPLHPLSGYNASWTNDDDGVGQIARSAETTSPKPIRFSLNQGAGGGRKHIFNKPTPNNSQAVEFNRSGGRGGGAGGKPNSRFGPPLTPLDGTVKPVSDAYGFQVEKGAPENGSPIKDAANYGLTNGSSWASGPPKQGTATGTNWTISRGSSSSPPEPGSSHGNSSDFATCINSDNWPASLRSYAEKWFTAVMSNDTDTKLMDKAQDLLRQKLEEAYISGNFNTKDWSKEQLPFFPSTQTVKHGFSIASIPGTVKGTPLKVDAFSSVGRGRGRGRGGSRSSPVRSDEFKNRQQGRPMGIRGRNRFKSRSTSRSWSRSSSRSSSSSSSSDNRSKKRKRSDSANKTKKNEKKYAKKEKAKGKKPREKKAQIYSEFGSVGGAVLDASNARLNARAARFAKDEAPKRTMKSRLGGFLNNDSHSPVKWGIDRSPSKDKFIGRKALASWDMNSKIVGTSMDLEKMYLRLTTTPDPSTIRPVPILKKSLQMVCEKWKRNEDYRYACDQLKSIRQDLTVQRVREPFTVLVYETHARIALEKGDHEEFNQCQSQLVQLYSTLPNGREHQLEFTAYRILYYIFTASTLDLGTVMASLSESERQDECISHALQVRSAWAIGDYHQFFKLHKLSPKMSGYLIDWFVNRERKNALRKILKSYRPVVPKSFLQSQLDLTDAGWKNFVQASQLEAVIIYSDAPENTKINARDSHTALIATRAFFYCLASFHQEVEFMESTRLPAEHPDHKEHVDNFMYKF